MAEKVVMRNSKSKMVDLVELGRYKEIIDNDFKTFPVNRRLKTLLTSWITNLSHKIFYEGKGFNHQDRTELRKQLLLYLNKKYYSFMEKEAIEEIKNKENLGEEDNEE